MSARYIADTAPLHAGANCRLWLIEVIDLDTGQTVLSDLAEVGHPALREQQMCDFLEARDAT